MKDKEFLKGMLFTAAGGIGWGISGVCGQYLFMEYNTDTSWLTSIRMLFSGLLLLAMAVPLGEKKIFAVFKDRKNVVLLILFAIAGLLLCQYTFLAAIKYSNSGTATVLQSLNVVIMAVVVSFASYTKMSRWQIIAIALAISGTYLIVTNGNPGRLVISPKGLTFGIFSAIGVVSYTLLSQKLIKEWSNTLITGWGMLIGGMAMSTVTRAWIVPDNLDQKALLVIAVIVVIGTAGGFSLFLEGVKYIGPVKGTLIACLEPATATALSALCLGTHFGVGEIIGFCAIMATVFISTKANSEKVKKNAGDATDTDKPKENQQADKSNENQQSSEGNKEEM